MKVSRKMWSPTHVPKSTYAIMVRDLLANPLTTYVRKGSTDKHRPDKATVVGLRHCVSTISALRIRRLDQLLELGWAPLARMESHVYIANCPPYWMGIAANDNQMYQPCKHLAICPWCWGRLRIRRIFGALQSGASKLGLDFEHDPQAQNPALVSFRVTKRYRNPVWAVDYLETWLEAAGHLLKKPRYQGYVAFGCLYPSYKLNGGFVASLSAWAFPEVGALRRNGSAFSLSRTLGAKAQGFSSANFANIRAAISLPLMFRRTMLMGGPSRVLACLNALKARTKLRLLRAGGACLRDNFVEPEPFGEPLPVRYPPPPVFHS